MGALLFSCHLSTIFNTKHFKFNTRSCLFLLLKMSKYVPSNNDLRGALIFCFHLGKSAIESHRTLVEAYGDHALGQTQCNEWFNKFKSGNFDVRNTDRGKPPKLFEDVELQALLDEDDGQTQKQLAEQLNVSQATISRRLFCFFGKKNLIPVSCVYTWYYIRIKIGFY